MTVVVDEFVLSFGYLATDTDNDFGQLFDGLSKLTLYRVDQSIEKQLIRLL